MGIRAVVFDLDGTLVDSALDFVAILQGMRAEQGLPPLAPASIRQQVSGGAVRMVSHALNLTEQDDRLDALKADFLNRYRHAYARYTRLFPGLPALLDSLDQHSIPWGVATNKPVQFAQPILQALQLNTRASVLVCPEHVRQPKPAPDMLNLACQQLQLPAAQVLYIGDDLRDIQAAQAAHMPSMAVGYGYHGPDDDPRRWGADWFVADSPALSEALQPLLSFTLSESP